MRNDNSKKFIEKLKEIAENPVCFNSVIGASFRSFANMIFGCYIPVYFLKTFPSHSTYYSIVNALSLLVCGLTSGLLGGILTDRYGPKYPRTYAKICTYSALLSVPMFFGATFLQGNFWVCMVFQALAILFAGAYASPSITMMQKSVSEDNQGSVVSVQNFASSIFKTCAPLMFGFLMKILNIKAGTWLYGPLTGSLISFGYLVSAFFYSRAGVHFEKQMMSKSQGAL